MMYEYIKSLTKKTKQNIKQEPCALPIQGFTKHNIICKIVKKYASTNQNSRKKSKRVYMKNILQNPETVFILNKSVSSIYLQIFNCLTHPFKERNELSSIT